MQIANVVWTLEGWGDMCGRGQSLPIPFLSFSLHCSPPSISVKQLEVDIDREEGHTCYSCVDPQGFVSILYTAVLSYPNVIGGM